MVQENYKKLYILLGILLIIIFVILRGLVINNRNTLIDYSKIEGGQDIITNQKITYDREIYYIFENILKNFIDSYSNENNTSSYKDYYNVLNSSYKSKLSRKEYQKICISFFKRLTVDASSELSSMTEISNENIVRSMYDLGDDKYVCVVGLPDQSDYGYLGIKLNRNKKTFEIFYLE